MREETLSTVFQIFNTQEELTDPQAELLNRAKKALDDAYAPYSGFQVGVALRLINGEIVTGSNQENAAYPMCLCAERVALSAASALFPGTAVREMAITCRQAGKPVEYPASPCGACRQVICETEFRYQQPIALLLQGERGPVYRFRSGSDLLPLAFSGTTLKPRT